MPRYRYRALDASGQMLVGVLDAPSSAAVVPELERMAALPIEIIDVGGEAGGRSWRSIFQRKPTREEITGVTEDLATLVRGGVTLDRALVILSETGTRPVLKSLMLDLHREISGGHSLAEAVAKHPDLFPRTYEKMVEVAEVAGTLDETLRVIAHERTRGENLRRRITSALAYPSFLIVAATGVLIFVLMGIIPEFERALAGFPQAMQGSTELVFQLSRALRNNSDMIAGIALGVVLGGFLLFRSRFAKAFFMRLLGVIPGAREVVGYERTVSFCATLGALTHSGVDISTALRLIRDLMRDSRSAAKIDKVLTSVRQGHRLTDALIEVDMLPVYAVHMLRVGEESGELGPAAMRIAGFYEGKLDRALGRLTSILGPAIMILVSLLIAWLIISVITALLSVNDLLI
jgi:general secretion pathway protein F